MTTFTRRPEGEEYTMQDRLDLANASMEAAAAKGCPEAVMGMRAVSISEDGMPKICFAFEASTEKQNRYGTLHGGMIASLLDEAMGMAATAYSTMQMSTVGFSVNYQKAGLGEHYVIEVNMENIGRRIIQASAKLYDTDNNKQCANAIGLYSVSKVPVTF
ncbi:MAG: PaaI family thioesterase [Firmicutes bacterium]|nr:PaaI family thioesterase [Bacillota bacterium]